MVYVNLSFNTSLSAINPLSGMVAIWRHIIVDIQVFGTERLHCNLNFVFGHMVLIGSLWQRVSFYWWMSAEWAARDEQPILPTFTNPCIPREAGTQAVKGIIAQRNFIRAQVGTIIDCKGISP
jgi:hypothetical protein